MKINNILTTLNQKLAGSFKQPEKVMPKNIKNIDIIGKVCAFTGYRPGKLPFTSEHDEKCVQLKNKLRAEIIKAIDEGYRNFITGMALGVDTWAAEIVLEIKNLYEPWGDNINLYAAIPHLNQEAKWHEWQKEKYNEILELCEKIFIISENFTPYCMHKRNQFMIDKADILIAVYDGKPGGTANTIVMANRKNIPITIINPGEIQYNYEDESEEESQIALT